MLPTASIIRQVDDVLPPYSFWCEWGLTGLIHVLVSGITERAEKRQGDQVGMSDDVLATIHGSDSDGGFEEGSGDETEGEYPEWDEEAYDTRSIQSFKSQRCCCDTPSLRSYKHWEWQGLSATGILVMH